MTRLNPRFGVLWQASKFAAIGGVTITSLVLTGCGGDAAPPAGKSKGGSPVASAPTGGPGYGGGSPYGQAAPEKPPRPEDIKAWTDQDYLDAKKENDSRIGPAALAYAQANVGKVPAGEFLVALVTKEPEVEGDAGGNSPYGGGYGRSTGYNPGGGDGSTDGFAGVIAALGVNNTKLSRDAIGQILAGKLATPLDDAEAVNAALKALASNANAENEAKLLEVLSTPEKIRPAAAPAAGAGTDASFEPSGVTAATLQQEALNLVAPTASAELRTKLAKRLLASLAQGGGLAGGPEGNPLVTFLLEPRPDNVEAQAALYALPALPAEMRSQIEANFLAFSSSALRELLNMPRPSGEAAEAIPTAAGYGRPSRSPGYGPGETTAGGFTPSGEPAAESDLTPEQAARVATSVWRNDMIKALAGRLPKGRVQRTASPANAEADANQPLLLLASMPVDPARAALAAWLERQRDDAPQALLGAGAFEQAMSDPGLLAIVKPLDREKRPARRARRDDSGAPSPGGAASEDADPLRDLVEVLCRRAREAGSGSGASSDFPVAFQGESTPSVQMAGDFPGSAKLKGLKPVPVAVHYAFVEQEHKFPIVQGHYIRQLKTLVDAPRVKELGDDGVWLDAYKRDKKTGKAQSVDVFIRKAGDSNSTAGGGRPSSVSGNSEETRSRRAEPENLTVEILVVETQTPPDEKPAAEVTRKP